MLAYKEDGEVLVSFPINSFVEAARWVRWSSFYAFGNSLTLMEVKDIVVKSREVDFFKLPAEHKAVTV